MSEVLSLQRDAINLHNLAAHTADDLSVVEDFLLTCGKCGYSGPEMFTAVERRQKLVHVASVERPSVMRAEIEYIKTRALLSNLMISRDFTALEGALRVVGVNGEERMLELAEVFAAKKLLADRNSVLGELRDALRAKEVRVVYVCVPMCVSLSHTRTLTLANLPPLTHTSPSRRCCCCSQH